MGGGPVGSTGACQLKLRGDATGDVMGLLTVPMALLSIAGVVAGLVLAATGHWPPVLLGLAAFTGCTVLAHLLEPLVIAIDDVAAVSLQRERRRAARLCAIASGAAPVAVIFVAEIMSLRTVFASGSSAPALLAWLWGYAVATGPWTLFAQRVSRFRRTLVGIRAYAGHLALWLFSLLWLGLAAPPAVVAAALLIPAVLPFAVGMLLALADRDAIANVRV